MDEAARVAPVQAKNGTRIFPISLDVDGTLLALVVEEPATEGVLAVVEDRDDVADHA